MPTRLSDLRPKVLLFVEQAAPSHAALRTVAWLGERLQADVLVAAVVERGPGAPDELDRARLHAAQSVVREATERLLGQGGAASGEVRPARTVTQLTRALIGLDGARPIGAT